MLFRFLVFLVCLHTGACGASVESPSPCNFSSINFLRYTGSYIPPPVTSHSACQNISTNCGYNASACINCVASLATPFAQCINQTCVPPPPCLNTRENCGLPGACQNCTNGICASGRCACANAPQSCGLQFPTCTACMFPNVCLSNVCTPPPSCANTAESCGAPGQCESCLASSLLSACRNGICACANSSSSCGDFPACTGCSLPNTCKNNVCTPPPQCNGTNLECGTAGSCAPCPNGTVCFGTSCACANSPASCGAFPSCTECAAPNNCISNSCQPPPHCAATAAQCGQAGSCVNCTSASPLAVCSGQACACGNSSTSCGVFPGCAACDAPNTCINSTCIGPAPACGNNATSCGQPGNCTACNYSCVSNVCVAPPPPCAGTSASCGQPGNCQTCPACNATRCMCGSDADSCGNYPACGACAAPNTCTNNTCLPPPPCAGNSSSCGEPGACMNCGTNGTCFGNVCACQNSAASCGSFPSCSACVSLSNCLSNVCTPPSPCNNSATSCGAPGACASCVASNLLATCVNGTCACAGNAQSCGQFPACSQCALPSVCANSSSSGGGVCTPPPPCGSNSTSCGPTGACTACASPNTCVSNTCMPPQPCAGTAQSCGTIGNCIVCSACTVCKNTSCVSCAAANTGGGSTTCLSNTCDCAFEGASSTSCGTFPNCKKCATGEVCAAGTCSASTAGGGGGGGGGCRGLDFANRLSGKIGPGGCYHPETIFSYNGLVFTLKNISLATRCWIHGTVYSDHGVYIETQDGNGVKLTGNHPVYTANEAVPSILIPANHLKVGSLVYKDQQQLVRIVNVTQISTPMLYYDVMCGGNGESDLMANGIKTRTAGW